MQTAFVLVLIGAGLLALGIVLAVLGTVRTRAEVAPAGEQRAAPSGGIVRNAFPVLFDRRRPPAARTAAGGVLLAGAGLAIVVIAGLVALYEALPSMLC